MPSPEEGFTFERTGHTSRNRTVLAAMTNKQSADDGTLSEDEINWLLMRAEGGFGIVTTAATHVTPGGRAGLARWAFGGTITFRGSLGWPMASGTEGH